MKRNNLMRLGYILASLVFAVAMVACTKDLPEPSDKDQVEDTNQPADEPSDSETPSDTEEPSDTETPSDSETPSDTEEPSDTETPSDTEDPADPADTQIEEIKTLLMSTKWSVSELYCLEEGGYEQPAEYYGDAILFWDENKLAYEDGGVAGFIYCDMNGWEYPYEELVPAGDESWDVVAEDGKYYIQFSNGGFPLIVVDASNIDCKCEILSTAEGSFQLKVVAETWGNYSYQVTYLPTSEIPEKPEESVEDESVVPESWAEGSWYYEFAAGGFGISADGSAYADLTNPSYLGGAVWKLSDPGVGLISYEDCIAIGDYVNPVSEFILTSKSYSGTVWYITLGCSFDELECDVTCTVGGTEFTANYADGEYAFTGEGSGEIELKFSPSGNGAMYLGYMYIEGSAE